MEILFPTMAIGQGQPVCTGQVRPKIFGSVVSERRRCLPASVRWPAASWSVFGERMNRKTGRRQRTVAATWFHPTCTTPAANATEGCAQIRQRFLSLTPTPQTGINSVKHLLSPFSAKKMLYIYIKAILIGRFKRGYFGRWHFTAPRGMKGKKHCR